MSSFKPSAVVLLSGGIDSATSLALALERELQVIALSFDYGQRHQIELSFARKLAKHYQLEHRIFKLPLDSFAGSALTSPTVVPKDSLGTQAIPVTYVPARNTVFLSIALALSEVSQASYIYIGANAVDYSGYPDCRPEYIKSFERMANLATKRAIEGNTIKIEAPLLNLTKSEIIKLGVSLGVDYSLTLSCYDPDLYGAACAHCDSCLIRKRGFQDAGVVDPTLYR